MGAFLGKHSHRCLRFPLKGAGQCDEVIDWRPLLVCEDLWMKRSERRTNALGLDPTPSHTTFPPRSCHVSVLMSDSATFVLTRVGQYGEIQDNRRPGPLRFGWVDTVCNEHQSCPVSLDEPLWPIRKGVGDFQKSFMISSKIKIFSIINSHLLFGFASRRGIAQNSNKIYKNNRVFLSIYIKKHGSAYFFGR